MDAQTPASSEPSAQPAQAGPPHALQNAGAHHQAGGAHSFARRDLFWQNVVREMLGGLAAAAATSGGRLSVGPKGAATGGSPVHDLFDGRMAVVTRLGQRIPIADVTPLFACSIPSGGPSSATDRAIAADVQCTVFQITTPGGEVYTLPVHEIAMIHSLSHQLVERLQQATSAQTANPGDGRPFGFAAFTSLANSERDGMNT